MSRKQQPDRNSLAAVMAKITGKAPPPPVEQRDHLGYAVPPSRRVKKAVTTWQDAVAVQQLKDLAHERGVSTEPHALSSERSVTPPPAPPAPPRHRRPARHTTAETASRARARVSTQPPRPPEAPGN